MSSHGRNKRGRPNKSDGFWLKFEMNEELDARKLSRAFLALAMHQASEEAQAEAERATGLRSGDDDASA
jgi:hypothetical protein